MDVAKLTVEEIKKGYTYEENKKVYICNYCEQQFEVGQMFSFEEKFFDAEHAVIKHIDTTHEGNISQLIHSKSKYNTLTQNQKDLLTLFSLPMTDKQMAKKLGVSESTIRRQRFTFREKAKQAKLYLALYEQIFEDNSTHEENIIPIHNNAIYVDDRYLITEKEKQQILQTCFTSLEPLKLQTFPSKEKKKVVILTTIANQFTKGKKYSEVEVNHILKPIYNDFSTIRRYLILYGFMERATDGSSYWLM